MRRLNALKVNHGKAEYMSDTNTSELKQIALAKLREAEKAPILERMNVVRERKEINLADLKRGHIVSWDWVAEGAGKPAIDKGVRPLGKIVSQEDLPYMSVREGELNLQTLDDPNWVLSPALMLKKGRKLYFAD